MTVLICLLAKKLNVLIIKITAELLELDGYVKLLISNLLVIKFKKKLLNCLNSMDVLICLLVIYVINSWWLENIFGPTK